jgi:hypothetical protein
MPKENLRLDSRFNTISAFWKPDTPDAITSGSLVSDENEIRFTTSPVYERNPKPSPGLFSGPDRTAEKR